MNGDCNLEIKRCMLFGRKAMTKLDRVVKKKKQINHFANKGPYGQSYRFSVVMYRCESWTIKKAES